MSKADKASALAPWRSAIGAYQEGAVEVVADGLKVHWAKLRVPDRTYEADFAWIKVRRGAVSLFFGKEDLDSPNTLRTRLEIKYPIEKFLQHFWKNSREFHATLRKLPQWPVDNERPTVFPEKMKAAKDHSECANFEYIARYGSESVLDFYYMPPSGIARLAQGMGAAGLRLDPVVRVQVTMRELVRLLDAQSRWPTSSLSSCPRSFAMTIDQFLETEVFVSSDLFFGAGPAETTERRRTNQVSSVSGRFIRTAVAVVALGVFTMQPRSLTASTARMDMKGTQEAGAAVMIPSLTKGQVRGARFAQAAFEAVPPGADTDGEDPDYGF